ncbi:hypothetical protein PtB15_1B260 [Puccinia triticina]|nr:hypothetical protein PtB15_1B260 [Puccinia triticina]
MINTTWPALPLFFPQPATPTPVIENRQSCSTASTSYSDKTDDRLFEGSGVPNTTPKASLEPLDYFRRCHGLPDPHLRQGPILINLLD